MQVVHCWPKWKDPWYGSRNKLLRVFRHILLEATRPYRCFSLWARARGDDVLLIQRDWMLAEQRLSALVAGIDAAPSGNPYRVNSFVLVPFSTATGLSTPRDACCRKRSDVLVSSLISDYEAFPPSKLLAGISSFVHVEQMNIAFLPPVMALNRLADLLSKLTAETR